MTFYCPACWREVPEDVRACPHCKANLERPTLGHDYAEKLIGALDHPEPTTPVRAAWILGMRREARAVARLAQLVQESEDPYIVEAAVEALGKIGDRAGLEAVRFAAHHGGVMVREKAQHAIDLIQGTTSPLPAPSTELGEGGSPCA